MLVVQPEVEVALQRLAQVEPEAHAAREADDRTTFVGHRQTCPQAPFSAKVDAPEHRKEDLCHHEGKLP